MPWSLIDDIHSFMLVARSTSSSDDSQHHCARVAMPDPDPRAVVVVWVMVMGAACDVIDTSRWPLASHRPPVWGTQCIQGRAAANCSQPRHLPRFCISHDIHIIT